MTVSSLIVVVVLIKADIVGRLAYSVEKGRIQALRESLPSAEELDARFESDRAVVAAVLPAVVTVSTEREYTRSDIETLDPRFHRFLFPDAGDEDKEEGEAADDADDSPSGTNGTTAPADEETSIILPSGQGSGFIINAARGHIVTNSHVVAQSTSITVYLADGRRFEARLLGADPKSDLAVLRIDAARLHEITLGDSLAMAVGDEVFAVGNPFGLEGTVSRGIVSATNRSNVNLPDIEYEGFLQTDAVINPGNSGGPLVNMRGEVVGVNTAIATRSGNYDGIGFAIPAHQAAKLIPILARGEKIARGYLGVEMGGPRVEERKRQLGWTEPGGVLVNRIVEDSPASRTDLRKNDIIVEYTGRPVRSNADVIQAIGDTPPGTEVEFKVWRDGGFETARVKLGAQPEGFSTRVRVPTQGQE